MLLSHLHLHLEPEQRKRRALGLAEQHPVSREEFFRGHGLDRSDRTAVTLDDLSWLIKDVHAEQAGQGVEYVEIRFSPRRFRRDGASWPDLLSRLHDAVRGLREPSVRVILLVNRDSPDEFVVECAEQVAAGLPGTFVGVDLAGDEARYPGVSPAMRELFEVARQRGLGVTVHAGEFGDRAEIWRAVDDLGAARLGHAVAAAESPALLGRLAADRILVELSITSNLMLGAVGSGWPHPVRRLVAEGVPVSFNLDIPLHTGRVLADEYALAAAELGTGRTAILDLQRRAYGHAFGASGGEGGLAQDR